MNRLLLIESGKESYRSFTFEALRRGGIDLVLAAKSPPTWQQRYLGGFVEADVDGPSFRERVLDHHRRQPVDGVLTFVERLVPLAAELAADMGIRAPTLASARAARDKHEMRRRFAAASIPVPRVLLMTDVLTRRPPDFPMPAVVKPIMGFASLNVFKIGAWSELGWAEEVIAKDNHPTLPDPGGGYMIEEYIDGPEYSVESVVSGERIVHYGITRKITSPEPFFEEVAHVTPAPLSAEQREAMLTMTERALRALDLDHCATHTELRISSRRGPMIIEVAARLGGDKIPFLVELSTGASPSLAAGRAALGMPVPPASPPARCLGICFFVPREPGVTRSGVEERPAIEGLLEFEYWTGARTEVKVPPEQFFTRLGYALVEGRSASEAVARMARVITRVERVIGVPLVADIEPRLL
ncbi:hypothetical protein sce5193 [Sorangium cellulosum So ce56]|uniref:ATP-grasp domain-containing protein n=1 Tax=Sorangium cellulosum (strain So ce56) TaxID=448385 RepID=A9FS35_SORC5|nr:ATP-grasp domain-containing protein [Sorangium cellulosum]CAN95356.1 hypothetical protein sce5193 [Sorangium cellulosum So ce56]